MSSTRFRLLFYGDSVVFYFCGFVFCLCFVRLACFRDLSGRLLYPAWDICVSAYTAIQGGLVLCFPLSSVAASLLTIPGRRYPLPERGYTRLFSQNISGEKKGSTRYNTQATHQAPLCEWPEQSQRQLYIAVVGPYAHAAAHLSVA